MLVCLFVFFFSSRRRHTRCALVTGVQTCALPIWSSRRVRAACRRPEPSLSGAERALSLLPGHLLPALSPLPCYSTDVRVISSSATVPATPATMLAASRAAARTTAGLVRPPLRNQLICSRSEEQTTELQSLMRI